MGAKLHHTCIAAGTQCFCSETFVLLQKGQLETQNSERSAFQLPHSSPNTGLEWATTCSREFRNRMLRQLFIAEVWHACLRVPLQRLSALLREDFDPRRARALASNVSEVQKQECDTGACAVLRGHSEEECLKTSAEPVRRVAGSVCRRDCQLSCHYSSFCVP
jgi:hypothetical protein